MSWHTDVKDVPDQDRDREQPGAALGDNFLYVFKPALTGRSRAAKQPAGNGPGPPGRLPGRDRPIAGGRRGRARSGATLLPPGPAPATPTFAPNATSTTASSACSTTASPPASPTEKTAPFPPRNPPKCT